MDEPEDLLQLVLGMTSPTVFRELFTEGGVVSPESFGTWFDQKTAQFGGRDVIQAVKDLVGHCTRFDYQQVSSELPPLDLGDLKPFFLGMMSLNNRRVIDDKSGLSFKTPEAWVNEVGVRSSYEDLIFDRNDRTKDAAKRVLGVGHKLFNKALAQAKDNASSVATVPLESLPAPLFVYVVSDRVTDRTLIVRSVVIGIMPDSLKGSSARLLKDWEVLQFLNELYNKPGVRRARSSVPPEDMRAVERQLDEIDDFIRQHLAEVSSSFKVPQAELVSVFWPSHVQKVVESE
jgi:hypothetical protein